MRVDTPAFAQKNVELAKDPRYVIELAFDSANTVLWYFTSHDDAALPPSGAAGSILSVIQGLAGTSQTLSPDTANASIGSISFNLVDRASIVTTTLGGQLVLGRSTRKQRVRIYVGYQGLAWADYTLVQTQLVTEIAYIGGAYKFSCADIQREMRKDIFDQAKTTLALSLLAADTTINVVSSTGFSTVAHGTSYSDAPSATVGYVKIEDEVIRYTGSTATTFTGCTRGALNTRAVDHLVDPSTADDRRTAVNEYVYLELPAVDLIYRLLTGKDRLGNVVMPTTWNLGIATSYVRLTDFTGIGKDLWDTASDQQGFIVRLEDLKKTDGKKFIEMELALLLGAFMPVYADGALGLKRMANLLAGAAYVRQLDESNIVSYGDLVHDFNSFHNVIVIEWNWDPLQKKFTRPDGLVTISIHGRGDPLDLKFRGLHGSRHSAVIIKQRFDALRDRYSAPPLRLDLSVLPSLNTLDVGDVVRVRLVNVRDFTAPGGGGPIDRSFEIQNIQNDWITGGLKLKLFASSEAPGELAPTTDATVLTTGWYTGTGTALSSVLTITGASPGHVTVGGSLAGNADLTNAGAVYYYDGDLQIDAGVAITLGDNVWLRVKGFLQINGSISGVGRGILGAAAATAPGIFDLNGSAAVAAAARVKHNDGTSGFIGSTEAGGGITVNFNSVRGAIVVGGNAVMPQFNLAWDGSALSGVPSNLRGSSGSSGMPVKTNPVDARQAWAMGGAGGAGGAGLCITCRGMDIGVAGKIDLSGGDGAAAPLTSFLALNYFAGSGAGGAPGGLLVLLDGAAATATGLTDAGFVAKNGKTPIPGAPLFAPGTGDASQFIPLVTSGVPFYSYYVGTGDGTSFPLPSLSDRRGGSRVQYVPANALAVADAAALAAETALEELLVANWTQRTSKASSSLVGIVWNGSVFVAVGAADTDAYIVTSSDALVWTERTNPKAFNLNAVAYGPVFVAVGDADGTDAYIVTSPDGITWTERANLKNTSCSGIVWNGSIFVAVGFPEIGGTPDGYIITSPDGVTWTERANPKAKQLTGVAWNGAIFVAVGVADGTDAYLLTSPDGVTWTERANPLNRDLRSVAWNGKLFVAVGAAVASDAYVIFSPDGIAWTQVTNPQTNSFSLRTIIWSGALMLTAGDFYTTGGYTFSSIMSSRNLGGDWVDHLIPAASAINCIAWSGKQFVAVGPNNGTQATLLASLSK